MTENARIVAGMISAALHTLFEDDFAEGHTALLGIADDIRSSMSTLYPLSVAEWETVLRDMAGYTACLIKGECE